LVQLAPKQFFTPGNALSGICRCQTLFFWVQQRLEKKYNWLHLLSHHLYALQVLNEEDSRLKVNISAGQNSGFQMKTHPNIDKGLYSSQSVLGLKDPQKPFPAGSPLGILKWRMQVTQWLALMPVWHKL